MWQSEELEARLRAKFEAVWPLLDERQQRVLAAAEATQWGHGGIRMVARLAGISEERIRRGVAELEEGREPDGRVRQAGAGRKPATEHYPELLPTLLKLVEAGQRGDPIRLLLWTIKSLRQLKKALAELGFPVSVATIATLLKAEGYSLQANAKVLEGTSSPDRNTQFEHINSTVGQFLASGDPVISVDTKKKEDIGSFARPGRGWRPKGKPIDTLDHDFSSQGIGKAISYGIYNVGANTGFVVVGTDHDTAAFAVNGIRTWWNAQGRSAYPDAKRLLITADGGGSNGSRVRAWKAELAYLAAETGLDIHVCHFPPGTSKWNKVEHRLFSFISMNWAATPLTSYEVAINLIAATTTTTGLSVTALLDTARYPTGVEIDNKHMAALSIVHDTERGQWNYTLTSNPATPAPPRRPPPGKTNDKTARPPVPTRPCTEYETYARSHPALTGISRTELDALVEALAQLHTPPKRGKQPALSFQEQVWATLAYRHSMTSTMTARHFNITKDALKRAAATIDPLLARHGYTVTPAAERLRHPVHVAKAVMTTTSTPG